MMNDIENLKLVIEDFINTFVSSRWRDRALYFLSHEKRWQSLERELMTDHIFDTRKMTKVLHTEWSADIVYDKMVALGAEDHCFSLLELKEPIHTFILKEKLLDIVGESCFELIYCPKSKVAYFQGPYARRCILNTYT
jgi:hypothetical protein